MVYPLTPPMMDLLILSIVKQDDSYGYQISQQLKDLSNMKDSALYPILRRLSDSGYVETYDQPYQGRNRKYYRITASGRLQYSFLHKEWKLYTEAVNHILIGRNTLNSSLPLKKENEQHTEEIPAGTSADASAETR